MIGQRGIACVKGEIHNVLAAMDASSSTGSGFFDVLIDSSPQDLSRFSRSLQDLHDQLGFYSDLASIDARTYFRPFFAVIESPDVSWQGRAAALQAIHKFLLYGLIVAASLSAADAMNECARALVIVTSKSSAHRSHRELLQLRALELFLELIRCPAGIHVSDESLCLAFEEMLALRQHPSASPLLISYAEDVLGQFILVIFARLRCMKSTEMLPPAHARERSSSKIQDLDRSSSVGQHCGYGPAALVRILRVIATLIDPAHNDFVLRLLGLRLVNMCLETGGTAVGNHPALVVVVQDDICKQILQNSQTDDCSILTLILRIVFDLFATLRRHIRVQLEVFFTSIHIRIASNPSAPLSQRRLILQSIVEICHEPNLLIGLYRNYDCEIASTNMFEDLVHLLNKLSMPEISAASQNKSERRSPRNSFNAINLLALESLLAVIGSIAKRFSKSIQIGDNPNSDSNDSDDFDAERLSSNIRVKADLRRAATLFNECGYKALLQIQAMGLLVDSDDPDLAVEPTSMAKFLLETPGLNKRQVGAYLGREDKASNAVLAAYVDLFELNGLGFVQALRIVMESFVIPGEAQMISRIMEQFAKRYFSQNLQGPIADEDAAFVLAFSVIMLNTDAHNPGVKTKMSFEQFVRNNRGINKGTDFPEEFLYFVYSEIVNHEIRIVSASIEDLVDSDGQGGVNSAHWEQLVRQSRQAGTASFRVSADHSHGKAMFKMLQANFAHLISFHLNSIDDPKTAERLVEGCHFFARICIVYDMKAPFNALIICLCRQLIENFRDMYSISGDSIMVTFGKSRRTHRCLLLVFKLILTYGSRCLCEGWVNVIHVILWLRQIGLLPESLCHMEDIRDSDGKPLPSYQILTDSPQKPKKSITASFFNSLWLESSDDEGYVSQDSQTDQDSSFSLDQESDHISIGLEAVRSCGIDQVFAAPHSSSACTDSLRYLVQTLIVVSTSSVAEGAHPIGPLENFDQVVLHENSAVFCLERLSNVVESNSDQLIQSGIWDSVLDHFKQILNAIPDRPCFFTERAVVNLIRLCIGGRGKILDDAVLLLPILLTLPVRVHSALADRLAFGLSLFLRTKSISLCDSVFSSVCELIALTRSHPRSFVVAMDTLEYLCRHALRPSDLLGLLHVISGVIEAPGPYVRSTNGVSLLLVIHRSIQKLQNSAKSDEEIVDADSKELIILWKASISCLCHVCISETDPLTQNYAVDCLALCLISEECSQSAENWIDCFDQLLLPMVRSVVEGELLIRISSLLFKVVLYYLIGIVDDGRFPAFWARFVDIMISVMIREDHTDPLYIHLEESLKNLIFVIAHIRFSESSHVQRNDLLESTLAQVAANANLQRFCERIRQELQEGNDDAKVDSEKVVEPECGSPKASFQPPNEVIPV